jgi:hypothetical protein
LVCYIGKSPWIDTEHKSVPWQKERLLGTMNMPAEGFTDIFVLQAISNSLDEITLPVWSSTEEK